MNITITHAELARLVTIVTPCVGKGQLLPVFTWVHFRSHEGHIEAQATDRYTMAYARGKAEMAEGFEFNMRLTDLKHLLASFRPLGTTPLTLSVDEGTVTATATQADLSDGIALTVSYKTPEGAWPNLDHILRNMKASAVANATFSPANIRKLPNLSGESATFVSSGDYKPCGFLGADWAVVIMPLRGGESDRAAVLAAWVAPTEAVAA